MHETVQSSKSQKSTALEELGWDFALNGAVQNLKKQTLDETYELKYPPEELPSVVQQVEVKTPAPCRDSETPNIFA